MALIKCSECGKEISDKSKKCIHCGCPINKEQNFVYNIAGVDYNLEHLLSSRWNSKLDLIKKIREMTGCDLRPAKLIVDQLDMQGLIKLAPYPKNDNTPKCPICNSTNLSKISTLKKAGKIGLFGIFGAGDVGKTWQCNNCGSKF